MSRDRFWGYVLTYMTLAGLLGVVMIALAVISMMMEEGYGR